MLPDSQEENASHRPESAEWTWIRGLGRGIFWALTASAILAGILDVLAACVPSFLLNFWVRMALAFFVSWILFAVVHRTSGMAGTACSAVVVLAAAAVFLSQHFVFAAYGVPTSAGRPLIGDVWLEPPFILATNISTCLGLLIACTLCHEGGEVWRTVIEVLCTRT